MTSLSPQIKTAGHRVDVQCPSDVVLESYPGTFSQIIGNFVMNSLIHGFDSGREGLVTIRVEQTLDHDVVMRYSDNGKGVPAAHLKRLFDPFFTTKMGQGGSGLGLNIVYNLVTGPLGGTINVDSIEGQGTTFTVTFPTVSPG
jgi:signal transduction histidine kinase